MSKTYLSLLFILLIAVTQCSRGPKADAIYFNGTILTLDEEVEPVSPEALAVKGEKILALGTKEDLLDKYQSKKTKLYDLDGKTLIPGFISSHMHFLFFGLAGSWIDTSSSNTFLRPSPPWKAARLASEILTKIKTAVAQKTAGTWIPIWAFDPSRQVEDVAIDRNSLDQISKDHPILVLNNSGHFAYVNTKALEELKFCGVLPDTPKDQCLNAHLSPSETENAKKGILQEAAVLYAAIAAAPKKPGDWVELIKNSAKVLGSQGYTTVAEGGIVGKMLELYVEVTKNPDFPLSVVALPLSQFYFEEGPDGLMAMRKKLGTLPPSLKIGPVKFYADGSPQGYSAFMLQAYKSRPPWAQEGVVYVGSPNYPDLLKKQIPEVHKRGDQLAIHINGDAATEMILKILEQAMKETPREDTRHQMIHLPFVDSNPKLKQLQRIKKNGFVATFLSDNIYYWGQVLCETIIGSSRTQKIYPAALAKKEGLKFSLHSDTPVDPPDPLHIIYTAVTRKAEKWSGPFTALCPEVLGADQAITIEDGLRAFTIHAAHQFFLEKEVGSLEEGKIANMAILSKNPLTMEKNPDELLNIKVLSTIHRGKHFNW